jgi:hypothetical protein
MALQTIKYSPDGNQSSEQIMQASKEMSTEEQSLKCNEGDTVASSSS